MMKKFSGMLVASLLVSAAAQGDELIYLNKVMIGSAEVLLPIVLKNPDSADREICVSYVKSARKAAKPLNGPRYSYQKGEYCGRPVLAPKGSDLALMNNEGIIPDGLVSMKWVSFNEDLGVHNICARNPALSGQAVQVSCT